MSQTKSQKKLNNYSLQYWLYAIIAKNFGKNAKMTRDFLHSRYEVNRHGFDVTGVDSATLIGVFREILVKAGFSEVKRYEYAVEFSRKTNVGKKDVSEFVSFRLDESIAGKKKTYIYPRVYK